MRREFSAGGVLVRRLRGTWMVAAIRPSGKAPGTWVLPKGQLEPSESSEAAALREIAEETGAHGRSLGKLDRVEYWFNWRGERVFKVVSFFLVRYTGGRLGRIADAFRVEVAEVRWLPLADAPRLLAYRSERDVAAKALAILGRDEGV